MVRRRRRKLWPLLLVLLLLSLWSMPLSAREPPYGAEDYTHATSVNALGDDDDQGMHIVCMTTSFLQQLLQAFYWIW
jgi:hypothetical protein